MGSHTIYDVVHQVLQKIFKKMCHFNLGVCTSYHVLAFQLPVFYKLVRVLEKFLGFLLFVLQTTKNQLATHRWVGPNHSLGNTVLLQLEAALESIRHSSVRPFFNRKCDD